MTIGLVMIVRDEEQMIESCLNSVKSLISHWTIVDTGSTDATKKVIRKALKGVPGELYDREFVDFAHNRTEALALAKGTAEWLLELDADMTVEAHPDFVDWLAPDPDVTVSAWMVEIVDSGTHWRLPRLMRGDEDWNYIGPVHEYLDTSNVYTRPVLGLTLTHHGSSRHPITKFDHYLQLLKPGLEAGEPRAVFYSAECMRFLNCNQKAIELYTQRASMNSFEEEAWYAMYQAAKLSRDVKGLIAAWERRPHRFEPLRAAAEIVRSIEHDDVLFLES